MSLESKITLYVLKCKNKAYYVGKTSNLSIRILDHFSNNGSVWTKLNPPLKVVETIENADAFDEDKYTKKYMSIHGILNVRGGSYVQNKLSTEQISLLTTELASAKNLCFKCGYEGHMITNCDSEKWKCLVCMNINAIQTNICVHCLEVSKPQQQEPEESIWKKIAVLAKSTAQQIGLVKAGQKCFKCGQEGHYADKCHVKKDVYKSQQKRKYVQNHSAYKKKSKT
jgi:predicted GIY-YIG superfamily endonuclease